MRCAVVVFPGSNCDADAFHVAKYVLGFDTQYVFHKESFHPDDFDLIILPGGFSYGDYLRPGAIARFSPVMNSVVQAAKNGCFVLGICNGFQILTEAGLLKGVLLRNKDLRFHCHDVYLRVERNDTPFTCLYKQGEVVRMSIAHGEGNYYVDDLSSILDKVVFRYCDKYGRITQEANPNGSVLNIAGVINDSMNVLGLMPHPERCAEEILGSTDGRKLFESLAYYLERRKVRC
ncbi:phosphoribosylformylglycinamidine synthase subunit PurQ [Pseudothermotoga thermarum]|uniref:Phosphoribosylformylglycinamidine synthase subunit PurQ n=1 Tax=Pseudothermotoga thermarum DSM 5069 TaxID=688269 RepID=F7YWV8_9THEM|nr:phosphoribosylformylglycinamidine synthase subunit PurQ [Pseudothermotoga thermarum]AEH50550.1 phosphoribosylformylglycinamidine synthase subunit I [Pseudothermotoga thermarum DSM 5069]